MASTSHKPRRRLKKGEDPEIRDSDPLQAFLSPAKDVRSEWVVLTAILLSAGLFRWATSLWDYSGYKSPPMHGDFEAQRHWMEITAHLPISQWYFFDLEWWGLDYPPLTAYHSWLLGKIGQLIDPAWFALNTSRALDDPFLKIYMRASVLISEYIFYVPFAVVCLQYYGRHQGLSEYGIWQALVLFLLQPSTLLIDHGHFQYNTVMLGFVLAFTASIFYDQILLSCIFFVAALGYKQMALYYAPAVFVYLLGSCATPKVRPLRLIGIAIVTLGSFALLFLPLAAGAMLDAHRGIVADPEHHKGSHAALHPFYKNLPGGLKVDENAVYYPALNILAQAIHRIFPFARGLFEDKVANFWCAMSVVSRLLNIAAPKLQQRFGDQAVSVIRLLDVRQQPVALVQRIALLATLGGLAIPCTILLIRPRKTLLPLGLAASAWSFFLFSFQVHEKSVLLPLLPMTLLLASPEGLKPATKSWVTFANALGVWTMFPLLKRDGLQTPYVVLSLLWAYLSGSPPTSFHLYAGDLSIFTKLFHIGTYALMLAWHVVEACVEPPPGKPDLWLVVNVLVGAGGFGLCYLWCIWKLLTKSGLLGHAKVKEL